MYNPNVHYHFQKSQTPDPVLSKINPRHVPKHVLLQTVLHPTLAIKPSQEKRELPIGRYIGRKKGRRCKKKEVKKATYIKSQFYQLSAPPDASLNFTGTKFGEMLFKHFFTEFKLFRISAPSFARHFRGQLFNFVCYPDSANIIITHSWT